MLAYIARRLASTILVMGIVGVFVFLLLHLSPGDPAAIIAGDNATPEQIARSANGSALRTPARAVPALVGGHPAGRFRHLDLFQRAGDEAYRRSASSRRCRWR